ASTSNNRAGRSSALALKILCKLPGALLHKTCRLFMREKRSVQRLLRRLSRSFRSSNSWMMQRRLLFFRTLENWLLSGEDVGAGAYWKGGTPAVTGFHRLTLN